MEHRFQIGKTLSSFPIDLRIVIGRISYYFIRTFRWALRVCYGSVKVRLTGDQYRYSQNESIPEYGIHELIVYFTNRTIGRVLYEWTDTKGRSKYIKVP